MLSSLHATVYIYFDMASDICIFYLVDKSPFHRSVYCPSFFILLYFSSGILFTPSVHDTYLQSKKCQLHIEVSSLYLQNCYFIWFKYIDALQRLSFLGNYSRSYSNCALPVSHLHSFCFKGRSIVSHN